MFAMVTGLCYLIKSTGMSMQICDDIIVDCRRIIADRRGKEMFP